VVNTGLPGVEQIRNWPLQVGPEDK
jgi:hypothetical protein